jgi:thymidylate synthase (FAD)
MMIHKTILDHGYVEYVDHMGDDYMPLEAARMSTGNPTGVDVEKDNKLRDYLWRNGHATPFEMSVLQVEVQCPIFVAREWMRHRTMSYNEFSGRYAVMPDLYYVPDASRVVKQHQTNKQMSGDQMSKAEVDSVIISIDQANRMARFIYDDLIAKGVAREIARCVLPVSQYTKFRAQANLRNWFNFLNLRMDEAAQYEIRVYAEQVAEIISSIWPQTYQVFEKHTLKR